MCCCREVAEKWFEPFLGYAIWFYGGLRFPVLQIIWPDKEQRYPWQPQFSSAWRRAQPLLYEREASAANVEALLKSMERLDA